MGKNGTWSSWVDASILHAIAQGMAMHKGYEVSNPTRGGQAWSVFFGAEAEVETQSKESDEALEKLWASAEQASTEAGYGLAALHGAEANGMESVLAGVTEVYRDKMGRRCRRRHTSCPHGSRLRRRATPRGSPP